MVYIHAAEQEIINSSKYELKFREDCKQKTNEILMDELISVRYILNCF